MTLDRDQTQDRYFEMLASMDLTKHLGSLDATWTLVDLCHIEPDSYILDVGCGVGFTPVYLARRYGCRVMGVDLHESMVERARERARREGLEDRVAFRQADMQDLPFEDGLFDAVIAESVVAFVPDKLRGLHECMRVTKPGGYVGFTEASWLSDPAMEQQTYLSTTLGGNFETYTVDGWRALLVSAGLENVYAEVREISIRREAKGRLQRIGCRNMMRTLGRFVALSFRQPSFRGFMKDALNEPKDLLANWGYGIYAGRVATDPKGFAPNPQGLPSDPTPGATFGFN
jgi:ubiquinone/menaquinone biosynthesis C-methylase UbiE